MYTETSSVEAVQTWLVSQLAKQLSINPQTIDVREPLTRYGLDSIDAVTFVGECQKRFYRRVSGRRQSSG